MAQPWDLQRASGVNGDFETRFSEAQSKSRDRPLARGVLPTAFRPYLSAR